LFLIFEIAIGIVFAIIILAALPKLLEWSMWAVIMLVGVALVLSIYGLVNVYKDETLVWLAVTIPVLFGAFLYDRFKYAPLRRAEINAKLLKTKKEKEQSDAAFKVFLAESLIQRKQREAIKDER
jgi:hypothetical protein